MKTNHHRKKFFTSLGSFLLAATILLNCTSCTLRVSAAELSAGYSRKATEQGTVDDTFITALSDFSLSLLRESLKKDGSNDLISPLSATLCLAMLANGAGGNHKSADGKRLGDRHELTQQSLIQLYIRALYR